METPPPRPGTRVVSSLSGIPSGHLPPHVRAFLWERVRGVKLWSYVIPHWIERVKFLSKKAATNYPPLYRAWENPAPRSPANTGNDRSLRCGAGLGRSGQFRGEHGRLSPSAFPRGLWSEASFPVSPGHPPSSCMSRMQAFPTCMCRFVVACRVPPWSVRSVCRRRHTLLCPSYCPATPFHQLLIVGRSSRSPSSFCFCKNRRECIDVPVAHGTLLYCLGVNAWEWNGRSKDSTR